MKIVLDNLDNVEEADKQFFEETDEGKFQFNRAKFEDTAKAGLLKKNKELLGKVKEAEKLGKFKDVADDDWTSYQEWKAAREEQDDDGDDKGKKPDPTDVKKLIKAELKKAQDAHAAALKAKDDEIAGERAKFDNYRFDQELTAESLEGGVIGSRLKKFKAAVIAEGLFGYRENKLVALDEDGEPTGESVGDRLAKLAAADEWKFFFEAKEAGGGSGHQKQASKAGNGKLTRSTMSPKEKSDYIKANGNGAFLKLPFK